VVPAVAIVKRILLVVVPLGANVGVSVVPLLIDSVEEVKATETPLGVVAQVKRILSALGVCVPVSVKVIV
jgi:hypothetical protein